ncbi:hypothetical protein R3P38DRAFT_2778277 [Favolaschia claudopus]|uniref:F-box domain-containing protein n=1 Tax=Favolaschia claudopus TaxID=2862362 RepID=A0AAW0BK04_9AGAR
MITNLKSRVSNLEETLTYVRTIYGHLQNQRKTSLTELRRGEGVLSVVRRLPEDILCEIFLRTLSDEPNRRRSHLMDRSPWVLGRVCSRWRSISIGYAKLWTQVDTELPRPLLEMQLERSAHSPLSVRLLYSDVDDCQPLISRSNRWESANLQMGVRMLASLEPIHGQLPLLRRLKCTDSTGVGTCVAFQVAPNLTTFILTGKPTLELPWAQLTRLQQRIPSMNNFDQLDCARNLVELSLTHPVPRSLLLQRASEEAVRVLEFPCLRKLYIEDGQFLVFMDLPALEDIYVRDTASHLRELIDRSFCSLLRVTSMDEVFDFISVLTRSPALLELRIKPLHDRLAILIPALTVEHGFEPLCPKLSSISLGISPDINRSRGLVNMIDSRLHCASCSPIRVCHIIDTYNPSAPQHASATLAELTHRGTTAEWLVQKPAARRMDEWREEFPQ